VLVISGSLPERSSERTSISSVNTREGVGSRAGEGRGWKTVAVAIKGTMVVAAGEITLNSLIIGVNFGEIMLSSLRASLETLSMMAILNEVG